MSRRVSPFSLLALCLCITVSATKALAQNADPSLEKRIDDMLAKLTLEQKVELIGGMSTWFTHEEPSIGLPSMRLSDGPAGMRSGLPATAYPAPVALAATWDTSLANRMGTSLGRDARARGVNILLGPGVNIARAPMGGRNFEYMGEDPYLASRIAVGYIEGVQSQGVGATVKHFMMNNQEFNRHNASSDADQRTMREIYLPAFEAAVKEAHVSAIMDSYNLVNGIHSTQNGWMDNTLAKKEWGFDGIMMSDWNSVYDGVAAANNGLDLEMPFSRYMSPEILLPAIRSGAVSEATVDDKVRRILRTALRLHITDIAPGNTQSLFSEESDHVALEVALKSIVLLKNDHSLLPLDPQRTCTLAIIGPNASPAVIGGGGSAVVDTYKSVSLLTGIADYVASHTTDTPTCHHRVLYDSGLPAAYDVFRNTSFDHGLKQEIFNTRNWTGASIASARNHLNEDRITSQPGASLRWTGSFTAKNAGQYYVIVKDGRVADKHHVFVDGSELPSSSQNLNGELYYLPLSSKLHAGQTIAIRMDYLPGNTEVFPGIGVLMEDDILSERARAIAKTADAVVIAAGFDKSTEHEGMDRTFELPLMQNALIRNIAAINPATILTLTAGGNVDMQPWLDRIPSLLHLWYPGQEGGLATAEVLFGEQDPEGKLPVSFEKQWQDNPTFHSYYPQDASAKEPHIHYTEGIFIGYRYYSTPSANAGNVQPQFPFGFGLSYTTFTFSNLHVNAKSIREDEPLIVSVDVRNTGNVAGAEVAQLYIGEEDAAVPRPRIELKGFAKTFLKPGETQTVQFTLDRRAFAYWSERDNQWKVDHKTFHIFAGNSSANLPLSEEIQVNP